MSADRRNLAQDFLAGTRWTEALRNSLAGDASSRRYERLVLPSGESAVLMDAPQEAGQGIETFVALGTHLKMIGLSPPAVLAKDSARGFLLLEDLGDAVFARFVAKRPDAECDLYLAAVDVLMALRKATPPDTAPRYDARQMARLTEPAFIWYAGRDLRCANTVIAELETLLSGYCAGRMVLALRDFHAENLIWLPDRKGPARVGLLDFQDAVLCHPAYDLVSLLEDARRDVGQKTRAAAISYYLDASGDDPQDFKTALAVLGLQRNLRILGVFARLSLRHGKPQYVGLLGRVWSHIERDLEHPALADIREPLFGLLPAPDPKHLNNLRSRCGKSPTP